VTRTGSRATPVRILSGPVRWALDPAVGSMGASLIPPSLLLAVGQALPRHRPIVRTGRERLLLRGGGVGVALTLAMVATAHFQFRDEEQS
jgi:hypothetical protein